MTDDDKLDKDADKGKGGGGDPVTLPDDHPLVKTLATLKQQVKELKASGAEAADKAKKYDELEEQNKSDLEKAATRAEAAEKKLADREALDEIAKVRSDVAKAKGLPESLLRGTSKEDFEDHADELIAAGVKAKPAPSSDGQGDTGKDVTEGDELSADEIVKAATGR